LLAAIAKLPRAVFVPRELASDAYSDAPLRISHHQVTTQPSLVAKMVEALALCGEEKVLELGTGCGYQTALLSMLAREVWSVELWQDMTDTAGASLTSIGATNVTLLGRSRDGGTELAARIPQPGGDPVCVDSIRQPRVAIVQAQADEFELGVSSRAPDGEHAEVVTQHGVDDVVIERIAQVEDHRPAAPADAVEDVG